MERTQLLELASKYGSPIYVYDTDKIESQYNRLTSAFSTVKNLKLNYAVKALSNINILKFFKNIGAGLDTVSIQEVNFYTPSSSYKKSCRKYKNEYQWYSHAHRF